MWADHYCVNKEFHERKAVKDSARAISGKLIRVYEKGNQTKSCERETLILLPTFNGILTLNRFSEKRYVDLKVEVKA